ncbi:MAG: DUF1800 domain-containing protein [Armatimonadaceae bacterium]
MERLSRRDALRSSVALGALGVAAGALGGCSKVIQHTMSARREPEAVSLPEVGDLTPTVRLLNRAAFGPAPGDVARVEKMGAEAWLQEQLNAPTDDSQETPGLQIRLATIDAIHADGYELRDIQDVKLHRQLQQATLLRAIYSPWQLRERMVDLWTNHFNIYAKKTDGYTTPFKAVDDTKVIRAHALGSFPEMLRASAKSPAMLSYLDNQENRKGVANENYARELLELHTLGVDGGYTQKDVQEVARCLTGWTIEDRPFWKILRDKEKENPFRSRGTFYFNEDLHDKGEKIVLGHRIPAGGGMEDGEKVLEIVALHPSTARFIAMKMVRYFYGTEDSATIESLAQVYQKTKGDIKAMLTHLLVPLAKDPPPSGFAPTMKRPYDFLVAALRATDANTDADKALQDHLERMGQPLFLWPMPDGYPDRTEAWTGSLLARWNFAIRLLANQIEGTKVEVDDKADTDTLLERTFARRATDPVLADLRNALAKHKPGESLALMLCSPAFQWR